MKNASGKMTNLHFQPSFGIHKPPINPKDIELVKKFGIPVGIRIFFLFDLTLKVLLSAFPQSFESGFSSKLSTAQFSLLLY